MLSPVLTAALTALAMLAFAGNSLLCRYALTHTGIDAASFTTVRLLAGAVTLWLLLALRRGQQGVGGSWWSALALFVYAAGFSYAYLLLPTATGALLLFGAVQATMIGYGLWTGERLGWFQSLGMVCSLAGLVGLLLPGLSAPPLFGALLMLGAGASWGVYSLRGKRSTGDPTWVTGGNFLRAVPISLGLSLVMWSRAQMDGLGIGLAVASGAVASGIGYAIWYTAMRGLRATSAATIQLSVPVITALGGLLLLGETYSLRLLLAGAAILGGIALVVLCKRPSAA